MSRIILQYVRPFLSPIDNMQIEPPLPPSFYAQEIANKIDNMGFPATEIIQTIKETPDTYITGSFMLHYLLGSPKEWQPNDIDIFTSDICFLYNLSDKINDKLGYKPIFNNDRYTDYDDNSLKISEINEYVIKSKKLQIIVCNNEVCEIIENFDLSIVKSCFDGENIHFPCDSFKSVATKTSNVKNEFDTTYSMHRTIERCEQYESRGIEIFLPSLVRIVENYKVYPNVVEHYFVEDARTNMLYLRSVK